MVEEIKLNNQIIECIFLKCYVLAPVKRTDLKILDHLIKELYYRNMVF